MVFVELPIFVRCAAELFSDEDIAELQNTLLENPAAWPGKAWWCPGDLLPLGQQGAVLLGLCLREECCCGHDT